MATGKTRGAAAAAALLAVLTLGTTEPSAAAAKPPTPAPAQGDHRPRTIVTTDPELDDSNSLVRYLLHSSDFDTEGIIYASSQFHWKGDGKGTKWWQPGREYDRFGLSGLCPCTSWRWSEDERFIHDAVDRYAKAYGNLKTHDPGYPTPDYLRSRIKVGNVQFDSDISLSGDSPGSDRIKDVLLDDEGGPVYLMAWGGPSTIARALKSIQLEYQGTPRWPAIQRKVTEKAVIVSFGTQDYSYRDYISVSWPGIELRQASTDTWGYGARDVALPGHAKYLTADWTRKNVSGVGPFGDFYRVWGDGKQMVKGDIFDHFGFAGLTTEELRARGYLVWTPPQQQGSWISEGDTSTFLSLLDNGLRSREHPGYGGWGGRLERNPDDPSEWSSEGVADRDADGDTPPDYAAQRWFGDAQQDFAARLRWTVTPDYDDANHHPEVSVRGRRDVTARPGQRVDLHARATDPDGDALSYRWWQYREAGSYPKAVDIGRSDSARATLEVPRDAKRGQTIHAIVEVADDGEPSLTSYQRVVITVR
ncbi:DUF1593 domain-containing protein [Streptomyces sp. A7024]|uniref:DUF1593 domain-containing protein n=1 Tax=Streptomyces coryli TaxID=1128680 RepID=A0A6G4TUC1_9ACTN|nr:DUF1593 domain-containing protein [Streptomyces coryli]NGN62591.1 DUF1593 domain-containing protein [Streptomyces coryli]